jgi:hypothetical protein
MHASARGRESLSETRTVRLGVRSVAGAQLLRLRAGPGGDAMSWTKVFQLDWMVALVLAWIAPVFVLVGFILARTWPRRKP